MKTIKFAVIILTIMAFTACNKEDKSQAVREIPVEDFFRNSEETSYQISPDGKNLSFMAPYENRMNVFVRPVEGGEAVRVTSETTRNVAGYGWANNERIIFLKDTGGDENYQLYGVKKDGSDLKAYTAIPKVLTQIVDILEDNEDEILIATNERNPQIFDLYRLNLNTGERKLIHENPGYIQGWQTDHEGKVRVAYALLDGVNTAILYRDNEEEEFRNVLTTGYKDEVAFVEFTPDNKLVYATTNLNRDKTALVLMDPNTCKELEVLYQNTDYDISGIFYSDVKGKLLSVNYIGHQGIVRHFFDEDLKSTFKMLEEMLPGYKIGITDLSKDENVMIVIAYNDKTPGTYYILDLSGDKTDKTHKPELKKIADIKPWIKEEEMGTVFPVTYHSRDGLNIEAYLTLPVNYTMENAKNLPVVINPHGGPWARDVWGYNPETQFLANRGYAVLQMNFRGSTGYGRRFKELAYKQWGQTMQNDITDGVNWLIEKGIADSKRIAIYGGSYGGYATLAGITKTPDLYACAVDYVGVSNLFTFMETFPPYWIPMREMMYDMVGDPEKDSVMMRENSPVFLVDKIKTPLFVAQGANDPRVNKAESDQMVEALRKRGVEVDYMVKDNEGHGFANEENRFDFYKAMESFMAKYLK